MHTKRLLSLRAEKIKRLRLLIRLNEAKKAAIVSRHVERLRFLIGEIRPKRPKPKRPELTPRENEVLDLILLGVESPEIASRLFISDSTVKKHIGNILGKLQMKNRNQLILNLKKGVRNYEN
jgi:DNA-binding NarL/FixJ family response regulator